MSTFSQILRQLLKEKDLTQKQLCIKTGIPKSTVSQYVSGASQPQKEYITRIADALDLSVDELISYKSEPVKIKRVKLTMRNVSQCLQISQFKLRQLLKEGCEFGRMVQGEGSRQTPVFYPGKFREAVGEKEFNQFFGISEG